MALLIAERLNLNLVFRRRGLSTHAPCTVGASPHSSRSDVTYKVTLSLCVTDLIMMVHLHSFVFIALKFWYSREKVLSTEMDVLRKSARKSRMERIETEHIKEIMRVKGKSDIIDIIEKKRLLWCGHIKRIPEERISKLIMDWIPPLWSSGQSFWLQIQRSRVRSPALPDFLSSSGSGTGSTQPREPREVN